MKMLAAPLHTLEVSRTNKYSNLLRLKVIGRHLFNAGSSSVAGACIIRVRRSKEEENE